MKKTITILAMALAMNAFAQIPTNSLVGYWPFTGNANDQSGNANNGTVNGAILTTDRFGNCNSAYSLNGSSDYIGTSLIQNNLSAYSVSMWFKTANTFGWMFKGSRDCSGGVGSRLNMESGAITYGADDNGYLDGSATSNTYNDNAWHQVVGVWDGTGNTSIAPSQFKVYIDGVLVSQVSATSVGNGGLGGHRPIPMSGTSTCAFGQLPCTTTGNNFDGKLDDIGIWNRALTQTEVTQLFTMPNPGTGASASITATGSTTFCQGSNVILTANSSTSYLWNNNATTQAITVTNAGNYTVTTTNSIGCTATSSTTAVTVNPLPTVGTIVSPSATVCAGTSITLNGTGALTYVWSGGVTNGTAFIPTSTTYTVTGTDANTCSNSATKSITVNPLPTVSINAIPNFININAQSIALTGVPTGGTFTGNGVSSNNFTPIIAGLGTSQITYNYSNSNNCTNSSVTSTIVYDTTGMLCTTFDTTYISVTDTLFINAVLTGINPPNNINTVKVFPNPANDHVTVDYGNYSTMVGYTFKITNSLGQTVFTALITQQSSYVDLSTWSGNGIYFVYTIDAQGNTIDVKKIVLQ